MAWAKGEANALPRRIRIVLVAAAALLLCLLLRRALLSLLYQIILAVFFAWAAKPICVRFEKRLPPGLSALLSLLSFLLGLFLLLWLLLPRLASQLGLIVEAVPQLIDYLQDTLLRLSASPWAQRLHLTLSSSEEMVQKMGAALLAAVPRALQKLAAAGNRLLRAFLAPALAFYFLRDRESFSFQASLLIPLKQRKRLLTALREMRREIAGYFRGQALIGSAVALLTALGLMLVGVPAWLLLGLIMGVCDLIPYVGPFLGAIPILLFSLPLGLYGVLWALITVILVQQSESMFLSPYLMSGAVGLHPAYVLLLLSAGGFIGGLGGMLLSLPLFVCLRGAIRALRCAAQEDMP